MKNPTVRFSTRKYEAVHGRKPRGYGLYVFDVKGCGYSYSEQYGVGMQMRATGTLTEAKREVKREIAGMAKANYGVIARNVYVDLEG